MAKESLKYQVKFFKKQNEVIIELPELFDLHTKKAFAYELSRDKLVRIAVKLLNSSAANYGGEQLIWREIDKIRQEKSNKFHFGGVYFFKVEKYVSEIDTTLKNY